jgi:hypothetical protein
MAVVAPATERGFKTRRVVTTMHGAYGSEIPRGQLRGRSAERNLILNKAQDSILHQLLGICTGFGGELRKLRFLLWREVYFHAFKVRENRGEATRETQTPNIRISAVPGAVWQIRSAEAYGRRWRGI